MISENKKRFDLLSICENKWVIIGIITFGIVCRITQYLLNPSLWSYEAIMVKPLLERSFHGLLEPMYEAAAPVGFLFTVKSLTYAFGYSHYVLRAFSLISGILALPLFYLVAKSFLNKKTLFFATAAFSISVSLCYWSHIVRPYSSDVLMTMLVLAFTIYFEKKPNAIRAALFAIGGALAIWFSYAAVFVLAGIGAVLFISAIANRQKPKVVALALIGAVWIVSLGILYKLSLGNTSSDPYFEKLYSTKNSRGFMPFPPLTFSDLKWYVYTFWIMSTAPLGTYILIAKLIIIPLLIGTFYMWRDNRKLLWMLITPIIIMLLFSALHKYPYSVRHTLFFAPMMLILTGYGLEKIIEKFPRWMSVILVCLIFVQPIIRTARESFIKPDVRENFMAAFDFVKSRYKDGDTIYAFGGAGYNFYYYSKLAHWHVKYEGCVVTDLDSDERLNEILEGDLKKLKGKTLWVIFGEITPPNNEKIIKDTGVITDNLKAEGASCFRIIAK